MDAFLPEIVKNLNFDQILSFVEDSEKLSSNPVHERYEKDFNVFQNFLFDDDDIVQSSSGSEANLDYSSESQESSEPEIVTNYPMHIKHGVINFSLSKIMENNVVLNNVTFKHETVEAQRDSSKYESGSPPLCTVCGKPALKYSSYGGLACTSCRSFFRRSARDNIYKKYRCAAQGHCESVKNKSGRICQLCRFNKCIRAGMRITWVLSQQERERRFVKNRSKVKMTKSLVPCFTVEEKLVLGNISSSFEFPWLENLFIYNQEAAKHLLEFTFFGKELNLQAWKHLCDSMLLDYNQTVMPKFRDMVSDMPNSQFYLLCLHSVPLVRFFRCCFAMKLPHSNSMSSKPYLDSVEAQVSSLLKYQEIYNNLDFDIIESLSRIQTFDESSVQIVPYETLFQDKTNEERNLRVMKKVQDWPQTTSGQQIPHLISLMCIILAFSVIDVLNDVSAKIVENVQLHYTITLQRYLKSHLSEREANDKFLEAMLLIGDLQVIRNHLKQAKKY